MPPSTSERQLLTVDVVSPKGNALRSREEIRKMIQDLWRPLQAMASASKARCRPGATGAVYDDTAVGMEGFCRPLWGVLACAAADDFLPGTEVLATAIAAGVDPENIDYWGNLEGNDQRCVELAVLAWGLTAAPGAFWEKFTAEERERLGAWIFQINLAENLPANNWRFFRVLANVGLRAVNQPYSKERLEEDLAAIEKCYLGDGWYSDGPGAQRDYYVAMAMHFYGLLIAAQAPPDLAMHASRYRARARLFAGHFIQWFVPDGSALPYGRSLIYRFAQGAFWSALAWANEEALPWGVIKGVLLRNLRWWAGEAIFDSAGVLSIGYKYPNLNMAESYNSPASPYWAMKSLLVGGLPEEHPFWQAEEEPLPVLPERSTQAEPGFIIRRHDDQQHITALASGQYPEGWHLRHAAAKYAKFAYGTRFGFSVPVGMTTLEDGAFDNMLALSDDGHHWRVREKCTAARMKDDVLVSAWSPWPDVHIRTWLMFDADWQVRIHFLDSGRALFSSEAGHAVPRPALTSGEEQGCLRVGAGSASAIFAEAAAGLMDPGGRRAGTIVIPTPNSNLLHPRTVLPTLRGNHAVGAHWLITFLPITCNPARYVRLPEPEASPHIKSHRMTLKLPSGRTAALDAVADLKPSAKAAWPPREATEIAA